MGHRVRELRRQHPADHPSQQTPAHGAPGRTEGRPVSPRPGRGRVAAECTSQGCAVGLCCACGALPQITAAEGTVHTAQTPYACNAAVLQQAAAQGLERGSPCLVPTKLRYGLPAAQGRACVRSWAQPQRLHSLELLHSELLLLDVQDLF